MNIPWEEFNEMEDGGSEAWFLVVTAEDYSSGSFKGILCKFCLTDIVHWKF